MSLFNNLKDAADKGTDVGKEFVTKTLEHTKLKAFQITALTISMIVKFLIISVFLVFGFIFLAVSAAIALGEYLNNVALGYLYVGLFFITFCLVFFLLRKFFDKKVISKVSKMFFN